MISVLILTLNEEVNIEACIASLPWRDDICVIDSESSDATVQIAESLGARIVKHPFLNYSDQRNFGLALPGKYEWILCLDADERMTAELATEIELQIKNAQQQATMFKVRRKDMLMGRWLRRSSGYPTWFPRLMRRGCVRVERDINEVYRTDGVTLNLKEHIIHYPLNKGIDWWFERHNRYSAMEAQVLSEKGPGNKISLVALFSRDPSRRRENAKALIYRVPGRPFLIFCYLYVFRLGFLDGRAGYHYACMRLAYELMIDAKIASHTSNGEKCQQVGQQATFPPSPAEGVRGNVN
jgi:glycosyltransferase involved in cell wall biosynthesis